MHGGRNGGQRGSCAALQLAGACTPAVVREPAAAPFGERLQPEAKRRRRRPEVSRRPRRPEQAAASAPRCRATRSHDNHQFTTSSLVFSCATRDSIPIARPTRASPSPLPMVVLRMFPRLQEVSGHSGSNKDSIVVQVH
ncbi:unnamed protein product [Urochloa humidicola]